LTPKAKFVRPTVIGALGIAVAFGIATHFRSLASSLGPSTTLHYTANGNFSTSGVYLPGTDGFNVADVESPSAMGELPTGVKALVWLGLCNGADQTFTTTVQPYVGDSKVFGFYLMDEPDPTGKYSALCLPANLKAESDWIHTNDPLAKTFIIEMNLGATSNPTYTGGYNPADSDIDLYGLDPYPCRTELNGCDYTYITKGVAAAESIGIPQTDIVPVYETFGGGTWTDDGGGQYLLPSASQEDQVLSTWAGVVPEPVFDYAYSWGSQRADTALGTVPSLQAVFAAHNQIASSSASPSSPTPGPTSAPTRISTPTPAQSPVPSPALAPTASNTAGSESRAVSIGSPNSATKISIDNTPVSGNSSASTTYLTNGNHTVTVTSGGHTTTSVINVHNKLSLFDTLRNFLFAKFVGHPAVMNIATIFVIVVPLLIIIYLVRRRITRALALGLKTLRKFMPR
jgi:hypothetical protein